MTLSVSNTNTIPIKSRSISCLVSIDIIPSVAPRQREPVSPINILAGCVLYTKNPNRNPVIANENRAISLYPSNHPAFSDSKPNVINAIIESPVASPSKPSVRLTELLDDVNTNKINSP